MPNDRVVELARQRFAFLKELYDRSGGDSTPDFPAKDIGRKLGFDEALNEKIYQYLKAEGLLDFRGMGPQVAIAHEGIKEIEQVSKQPEGGTAHFPANVVFVGQMTDSQIIQASPGASQSYEINAKPDNDHESDKKRPFYMSGVFWTAVGAIATVVGLIIALL